MKPVIICFIGIDGAGKTTLSRLISELLNKKGKNTRYVHLRFDSFIFKILIKLKRVIIVRNLNPSIVEDYYKGLRIKSVVLPSKIVSLIYKWFILFDYYIQVLIKLLPYIRSDYIIVCDRYIHDTIVDLTIELKLSRKEALKLLNLSFKFIPKPDKLFIIDVPERTALARKNDIPSLQYLTLRRRLYLTLFKDFATCIVDGSRSLHKLITIVLERIASESS